LSGRDLARLNRDGLAAKNPGQALELFDAALAVDHPVVVAARLDRAVLDTRPAVATCRCCLVARRADHGGA
jgi:4-hydroxyphenylalkanoate synthase